MHSGGHQFRPVRSTKSADNLVESADTFYSEVRRRRAVTIFSELQRSNPVALFRLARQGVERLTASASFPARQNRNLSPLVTVTTRFQDLKPAFHTYLMVAGGSLSTRRSIADGLPARDDFPTPSDGGLIDQ